MPILSPICSECMGNCGLLCAIDDNITTTMIDPANEKESILSLPLQERTVAVALKHIFDRINDLQEEETKETQKIHHSFIARFKGIEQQASTIIKGGPIQQELLNNTDNFFTESERGEAATLAKNNKGIQAYWLTAILNFYQDALTIPEKEIAAAIVDISTNVTATSLEFTFEIGTNEWLQAAAITKRFILEDGVVARCEGDNAKWLKPKPEGLLPSLLSQITDPNDLHSAYGLATDLINEIVPYSLEYFLGAIETIEEDDLGENQQEEDEEQEEEQGPSKRVKE